MSEARMNLPMIPAFPNDDSECASCWSACCRTGTIIPLTRVELDCLQENGADLRETASLLPPSPAQDGSERSFYTMQSDCPNLIPTAGRAALCGIYDSPEKPEACSSFEAGSRNCQVIREDSEHLVAVRAESLV